MTCVLVQVTVNASSVEPQLVRVSDSPYYSNSFSYSCQRERSLTVG